MAGVAEINCVGRIREEVEPSYHAFERDLLGETDYRDILETVKEALTLDDLLLLIVAPTEVRWRSRGTV